MERHQTQLSAPESPPANLHFSARLKARLQAALRHSLHWRLACALALAITKIGRASCRERV